MACLCTYSPNWCRTSKVTPCVSNRILWIRFIDLLNIVIKYFFRFFNGEHSYYGLAVRYYIGYFNALTSPKKRISFWFESDGLSRTSLISLLREMEFTVEEQRVSIKFVQEKMIRSICFECFWFVPKEISSIFILGSDAFYSELLLLIIYYKCLNHIMVEY